jgi:hypothetical protein
MIYPVVITPESSLLLASTRSKIFNSPAQQWRMENSSRTCPRVWPDMHCIASSAIRASSHLSCASPITGPCVLSSPSRLARHHALITHVTGETRRNGRDFPFVMKIESKERTEQERRSPPHTHRGPDKNEKRRPFLLPRDPAEAASSLHKPAQQVLAEMSISYLSAYNSDEFDLLCDEWREHLANGKVPLWLFPILAFAFPFPTANSRHEQKIHFPMRAAQPAHTSPSQANTAISFVEWTFPASYREAAWLRGLRATASSILSCHSMSSSSSLCLHVQYLPTCLPTRPHDAVSAFQGLGSCMHARRRPSNSLCLSRSGSGLPVPA